MLKEKMRNYNTPQKIQDLGLYPYFRTIESEQDTEVIIGGKKILMFGSNSYLGLTNHPKIIEDIKSAVEKYGSGCAGSRFLNGTLDIHLELEEKLANFVNKENALIFPTGYQVNLGVVSAIPGRHDYIILDDMNHACIIDGARLSFGKVLKYKHNDMDYLERVLAKCDPDRIKIIATDGVFSMEGDLAKLPEIVALAKKYKANILVDDAHGIGVMGKGGRGTSHHFGVENDVDLIMGTFSKSLASIGGFIASDNSTINYLKHNARALMFSASIAPGSVAAVLSALKIMEQEPERLERLWENTEYAKKMLQEYGFEIGRTQTPILPILVRNDFHTFKLTKMLLDEGIFVNPVVSPAVPSSSSLIRFTVMCTHSKEQIDRAISTTARLAHKLGILPFNKK